MDTATRRGRLRPSRLIGALGALALAASGAVLPAQSASAADRVDVSSIAGLRAAFSSPCGGATASDPRDVHLTASFGSTYLSDVIYVSCHVVLHLDGRVLSTGAIAIRDGISMRITDVGSMTGALYAYANTGNIEHAGIRTSQATLTIDHARVVAIGASLGAGIGGGGIKGYGTRLAESGGTVNIINGANVTAYGYDRGAAIGGGAAMGGGRGIVVGNDGGIGRGGPGPSLVVSGATTRVVATATYGAGIGGGNGIGGNSSADGGRGGVGGTISITDGATVTASSYRGAGIGGGTGTGYGTTYGGQGGSVVVENSTVVATSTVAAGIGGGDASEVGSHGGTLTVRAGAKVTATSGGSGSGFGAGRLGANNDSQNMRLTVEAGGTLDLASGSGTAMRIGRGVAEIHGTLSITSKTLTIDSTNVTIGETGLVAGATTTLNGAGTIVNEGTIRTSAVSGITITRNNFPVRFHRTGGGTVDTRIYAPSFSTSGVAMPNPAPDAGWNSASDGTGSWVRVNTPLSPTLMPEAPWLTNTGAQRLDVWESPAPADPYRVVLDAPATAAAGERIVITAHLYDNFADDIVAGTGPPTITVDGTEAERDGNEWRLFTAPGGTITARIVHGGETYSASAPIEILPGDPAHLTMTPATGVVVDGGSLDFEITGSDAWGNELELAGASVASSDARDDIDDLTVTFTGGGERTVSATATGFTTPATASVMVHDDSTRYATQLYVDPTVTAGEPFEIDAKLVDVMTDTERSDPYTLTVWTSRSATEFEPGERTETAAGELTIHARAVAGGNSYEASATIVVEPGELATLTLAGSTATVYRGGEVTFTVAGRDQYENEIDTSEAELAIVGGDDAGTTARTLTFAEFGDFEVMASYGGSTARVDVAVRPDPDRTELRILDTDGTTIAGEPLPLAAEVFDSIDDEVHHVDLEDLAWSSTSGTLTDVGDATGIETRAGEHTHTVTIDFWGLPLSGSRTWDITAADAASVIVRPRALTVHHGSSHRFAVSATDAYGNAASLSDLRLSSSNARDTVSGRTVTFFGDGTRTVTAAVGTAVDTSRVVVDAVPAPRSERTAPPATGERSGAEGEIVTDPDTETPADVPADEPSGAEPDSEAAPEVDPVPASAPSWLWLLVLALAAAVIVVVVIVLRRR